MFDSLHLRSNRTPRRRRNWPKGATVRNKFGQDVLWCPTLNGGHHMSEEELEPYRQVGDPQVDMILELLQQEGTPLLPGDDLVAMAEKAAEHENNHSSSIAQHHLASFLRTHQSLPSWVDVDQLERGQEVYLAYAPAISLSLYYRSLVAGFSIPKIAAVIRSTGYLSPPSRPDQVLQRLLDTGQLIAACCAHGKDALLPSGNGWRVALHVRALHAKVRRGLLTRKGLKKWDTCQLGIPINQEDMAGTLLGFSVNPLLGIEFVAGTQIPRQEMLDYLALWRYIGWLLGVETCDGGNENHTERPCPLDPCGPGGVGTDGDPVRRSRSILDSIIFHILDPDETSVEVANHLLNIRGAGPAGEKTSTQNVASNKMLYFRALLCRRFIGNPLADALCLPVDPNPVTRAWLWIVSTVYLVFLRCYTLAAMIQPLRRRIVHYHQYALQKMHIKWQETHRSRMTKALRNGVKLGISDESDAGSAMGAPAKLGHPPTEDPCCCPFAMVAPPTIDIDRQKPAGTKALGNGFSWQDTSSKREGRFFYWCLGIVTIPLIAVFLRSHVFDK